jgi:hypothetical protein
MATLDVRITNNATGSLSAGIDAVVTELAVKGGEGADYPATTGDLYFYVTLQGEDGAWEIVQVTERATDTFTIIRNIDSSTGAAQAFSADDIVSLRPCQAIHDDIVNWINDTNGATIIIPAPAGTAMIFYQATAPPGWTTDEAVADCVLAFKGGSDDYDDDAGTLVGSWQQPVHDHDYTHTHDLDHTHDVNLGDMEHNHKWLNDKSGTDNTFHEDGSSQPLNNNGGRHDKGIVVDAKEDYVHGDDAYTDNSLAGFTPTSEQPDDPTTDSQSATDTDEVQDPDTWRPYAALSICAVRDA